MKRRISFTIVSMILALVIHVVVLVGVGVMLRAGSGPLKNGLPTDHGRYIVLIDTDQYAREVDGNSYYGLPDSHDFSKSKDFFAIFPSLYCSGTKKDGKYVANFCSSWGKQFFDQHRSWRVWGVDIIEDKLIGQAPKLAFMGLCIAGGATALTTIVGILALWFYWGVVLAMVSSWIVAIMTITVAAFSDALTNNLIRASKKFRVTGTGTLVVHRGPVYMYSIWIAVAISLGTGLTWTFITCQKRNLRKAFADKGLPTEDYPFFGVVRRVTGEAPGKTAAPDTTSYKHLSKGHDITEVYSLESSQVDLIPRSQSTSLGPLRTASQQYWKGRPNSFNERDPRYIQYTGVVIELDSVDQSLPHSDLSI